ncbi:MAG: flagellar basal body P-ring formation chaperone FlgA [Rhodospirillaceae bacterium]|nr:flagellar basal body P-ring formation chaperone FlgA [Rhodospirillaceae bacterium]
MTRGSMPAPRRLARAAALAIAWLGTCGAVAADPLAGADPAPIRLNMSINLSGEAIRLGDLFSGELMMPDKTVARAPAPGQRFVLPADWLADVARQNGIDWRPANAFDRAMVYRPGHVIAGNEILDAIKGELIARGMPRNFGLKATPAPSATIPLGAPHAIAVREAMFDENSGTFSAVAEIPAGDPHAQFLPVRGKVFPVVSVATLKQGLARNTIITADMVALTEIPESDMAGATVTDPAFLIGKSPRAFIKAGQQIRETDVSHVSLVDIPVLRSDVQRGTQIEHAHVMWISANAADLPADAVTDEKQLVGKTPKRFVSAGAPVRRGDIQTLNRVEIPVAARDIRRGTPIEADDLDWIEVNETDIASNVVRTEGELVGMIATQSVRAGQTFRPLSVARAVLIPKGKAVTVIYTTKIMTLTAKGQALEDGGAGQMIRVANNKSKTVVFAEVVDAETVRVTETQTAMNATIN